MNDNNAMTDWRCRCGRLLGKRQGNQIHIQISEKHRYAVDGKVTSVCPKCGSLNSDQTSEITPVNQ